MNAKFHYFLTHKKSINSKESFLREMFVFIPNYSVVF